MTEPDARADVRRAAMLLDLGRVAEARSRLAAFLAAEPEDAEALRFMASCESTLGDHARAVRAARASVAADPACADGYLTLASVLYSKGDYRAGVVAAREVLRLDPELGTAHWYLGSCLWHYSAPAALAPAERFRQFAPHAVEAHLLYGVVVEALGRIDEARESYLKALSIDPNCATAHNNLAALDVRRARWLRALGGYWASLRQDPQGQIARENLAHMIAALLIALDVVAFLCAAVMTEVSTAVGPGPLRVIGIATVGSVRRWWC